MTELLTAAQMRSIETAAMESGAVTGLELMERAGRGVVEAVFREWPIMRAAPHSAVVLCGPGNNGGDGFVIARLLRNWGWEVAVFLYGDPEKLPPDAKANYVAWSDLGATGSLLDALDLGDAWQASDLIVDALFGTGLTRPLEDLTLVLKNLEDAASSFSDRVYQNHPNLGFPRVVAVDIPSGLDADSGRMLEPAHGGTGAAGANLTVSFHRKKLGHVLAGGSTVCGKTVVADIGLDTVQSRVRGNPSTPPVDVARQSKPDLRMLEKHRLGHKYIHGHALVLSGPVARSGAARLAARGALRIGSGLVTLAAPGSAIMECAAQLTAIMLKRCDNASDLAELLDDARFNALCLGPGLGVGEATESLVRTALGFDRNVVLDADALTSFTGRPETLFELTQGTETVLTPHGGEFEKLFPDIAAKLSAAPRRGPAYSKVDATREAAARAGCTILFKGPDTVISDAQGNCRVNAAVYDRAVPWLATAGAGDVLAGLICGLMARGLSALEAAQSAAWIHVEAARAFGQGLIAEDLPEMVPTVFRALETG